MRFVPSAGPAPAACQGTPPRRPPRRGMPLRRLPAQPPARSRPRSAWRPCRSLAEHCARPGPREGLGRQRVGSEALRGPVAEHSTVAVAVPVALLASLLLSANSFCACLPVMPPHANKGSVKYVLESTLSLKPFEFPRVIPTRRWLELPGARVNRPAHLLELLLGQPKGLLLHVSDLRPVLILCLSNRYPMLVNNLLQFVQLLRLWASTMICVMHCWIR